MTPEELQRAIEFIVQHQALFAARLESQNAMWAERVAQWEASFAEEREERLTDQPRLARVEAAFVRLGELVEIEAQRLDVHERTFYALIRQGDEDRRQAQLRHDEAIAHLKQLLDRLTDKN